MTATLPASRPVATPADASLRTGWEPDVPVGDSLLRGGAFSLAASWQLPVAAMGGRVTRSIAFAAADLGRPAGYWNSATLLQPLPPGDRRGIDAVVAEIDAFYAGAGTGQVLLWSAWPTPDLRARGWTLEGHPPLLVRPPGPVTHTARPDGLRIERVTDAAGVREFERVAVDGYPMAELQPLSPGSLFDARVLSDDRIRLWIGYERERIGAYRAVAIGSLVVDYGMAVFMMGVTMPDARHRGYWAAMAAHRLEAVPHLPTAGVFSDMSRPAAEGLFGFLPITRFTLWSRQRP